MLIIFSIRHNKQQEFYIWILSARASYMIDTTYIYVADKIIRDQNIIINHVNIDTKPQRTL
jgi:hypothetical protein